MPRFKTVFSKIGLVCLNQNFEKQEAKIVKILFWHGDKSIERVTGVYHQIGDNCEKLQELLNSNWTFAGTSEPDPESNNDTVINIIHGKGLLVPEFQNPADSEAVAVYLKMVEKVRKPNTPPTGMIKIGYLPRKSKLKKAIKRPLQVDLRCRTISALAHGNYFQAEVIGLPLGIDHKKLTETSFEVNAKNEKE